MRWKGREGSRNIEDRRRMGGAAGIGGLGAVAVLVIGLFLGIDPAQLLGTLEQGGGGGSGAELTAEEQAAGEFVAVTLKDTEDVWARLFREQLGAAYRPTTLVLFRGGTASPCGGASEATGPLYCPADRKVYLDTAFFATLQRQLGASGDFAAAYVVAHEVGHHVQNELQVLPRANEMRARVSEVEANRISVMIELQADCLAGVWAHEAERRLGTLEEGDIEEAMNAASRIGDDTLQRNAGRRPMPDSFTHGSSEQRMRWFHEGFRTGDIRSCDTFAARQL